MEVYFATTGVFPNQIACVKFSVIFFNIFSYERWLWNSVFLRQALLQTGKIAVKCLFVVHSYAVTEKFKLTTHRSPTSLYQTELSLQINFAF